MKKLISLGFVLLLSACSTNLTELAKDKATACISQKFTGFGYNEEIVIVRSNSDSNSTGENSNGCSISHNAPAK